MCEKWFQRFKTDDFNLEEKVHHKPSVGFEDQELDALLHENPWTRTQQAISEHLKIARFIQKQLGPIRTEAKRCWKAILYVRNGAL